MATGKQRAIERRLQLHVVGSAAAGAVASTVSAVLIAYAIVDIERQWIAQRLYTVVFAFSAVVFCTTAGAELLPEWPARWGIVGLSALTAVLSHLAPYLPGLSRPLRVLALTSVGTGLGCSLLISSLVLLRLALETRGVLPEHGPVAEGLVNPQQLLALSCCALAEGAYFGLAIGVLETQGGPRPAAFRMVALPHEAPAVVFPLAAAAGCACGAAIERLRQRQDKGYVRGVEMQVCGAQGGITSDGEDLGLLDKDADL
mmetsp:Transcript_28033/g.80835  ORF Transcript_28033/g.80835 Transcript_28033/m.80835 type:complete len:258 (-) Transcript_28033:47-820(-)